MADRAGTEDNGQRPQRRRRRVRLGGVIALGALLALIVGQFLMPRSARPSTPAVLASAGSPEQENPRTAFEPSDWPLAPVGLVFGGILALLAVSCLVLIVAYPAAFPDVDRARRVAPPGPRLQTDPESDLALYRADETRRLDTYYWIDRQKGIVHIPIEQAMKNLARTGIPGFPKGQP